MTDKKSKPIRVTVEMINQNAARREKTKIKKLFRAVAQIDAPSSPCSADVYLSKPVSWFTSATANIPSDVITIRAFISGCKNGKWREQIERIRSEQDREKRARLKMQLPAVTMQSVPCERRGKEFCTNNGIIVLDFDDVDDVEEAKRQIIKLPFVLAVFTSASGRGVLALCALVEPTTDLKAVILAMQPHFEFIIDEKCSDVCRLRFVTFDPEPAMNKTVVPFVLPITTSEAPRRADGVRSAERNVDRVIAYIEKMPPAVSGQRGHDAALNVANKLYEFGLTEDEAFPVFKEYYNPRCQPDWAYAEIRHKVSEAYNKPLR
jgi:hypothetical protein